MTVLPVVSPCSECTQPATVQALRPATDAETAAYRAQYAHLPPDSPALTHPMQTSVLYCCQHHGPDRTCTGCDTPDHGLDSPPVVDVLDDEDNPPDYEG